MTARGLRLLLATQALLGIASGSASPSQTPSEAPSQAPTFTLTPTGAPTTGNPTSCGPTSCSPTTDAPTLSPTLSPTKNPTSAGPSAHPVSMNPTSCAPTQNPTVMEYPKNRYDTQHEPDYNGNLWVQSITNAGEIIWERLPGENVTQNVPLIHVDTPLEVETWTRNESYTIKWHVSNIAPGETVSIQLFREHFHPRMYVKTIILNQQMITNGATRGEFTWDRVWLDDVYSIDTFFLVRICWHEQSDVCANSKGVFRITPNVDDRTHIRGSTGVVGTGYEWERHNAEINFDPAEGEWPNSLNHFM